MMKLVFLILLACIASPLAALLIQSENADYNGTSMTLSGHVVIEHELGKMTAEHVELIRDADSGDNEDFQQLILSENVCIVLQDGSSLKCSKASLDLPTGQVHLLGTPNGSPVISRILIHQNDHAAELIFATPKMDILLEKSGPDKYTLDNPFIQHLQAHSPVKAVYQQELQITAEKAYYTPNRVQFVSSNEKKCRLSYQTLSTIDASQIEFDLERQKLIFEQPEGTIQLAQSPSASSLSFTSQQLIWNRSSNLLILDRQAHLHFPGNASLFAAQDIVLQFAKSDQPRHLQTVESYGKTIFTCKTPQGNETSRLTCYGRFFIDHVHQHIFLSSGSTSQSPIPEERSAADGVSQLAEALNGKMNEARKQVTFHDRMGTIQGNDVQIDYLLENKQFTIKKIHSTGNVRLQNQNKEPFTGQANADVLSYYPQAREASLTAHPGNRVLFYDTAKKSKMAATAIHIRRDAMTGKSYIQADGNVRLVFDKAHIKQLYSGKPS